MSKQKIFSVVTKAGVVTRTSATKDYTHAIVVDQWPVTWCSRYDLAVKALKQYEGGEIQETIQLDKAPADPYKGVEIFNAYVPAGDVGHRITVVIQDGVEYNRGKNGWAVGHFYSEKPCKVTGYLERLAIMYKLNKWKEVTGNGKK